MRLAEATSYIKWRIARTAARLSGSVPATGKVLTHEETLLHQHDYLYYRAFKLILIMQGKPVILATDAGSFSKAARHRVR